MIESFTVAIKAPAGTDVRQLLEAVLTIGWEDIVSRSGDSGWQKNYPALPMKGSQWDEQAVTFTVIAS